MVRLLTNLLLLPLLLAGCSKDTTGANEYYIYGQAAENTSETEKMAFMPAFDAHNSIVEGAFEVYLKLSDGSFSVKDSNNDRWALSSDGKMGRNKGESVSSDDGIYRIRINTVEKTWSKIKINSVKYHPFFGSKTLVEGMYRGRGEWSFAELPLNVNTGESVKYYRFDVDTDNPAELAHFVYTSDVNNSDPKSYKSQYQFIRSVGKDDIKFGSDGSTASFRFRSSDEGAADISLKMTKAQTRHIHYVDIVVPKVPAAFIGDSITDRWNDPGSGHPNFFTDNNYLNFGISGQTSNQIKDRFKADVVASNPVCAVILCGTNDIAGNQGVTTNAYIMNNIKAMADMAVQAGIKVVLCSVLPCDSYYWKPEIMPQDRIDDLNARIKKLAADNGYVYVDYFSEMEDGNRALKKEYQEDPCHPNPAGYVVMERVIKPVIDSLVLPL